MPSREQITEVALWMAYIDSGPENWHEDFPLTQFREVATALYWAENGSHAEKATYRDKADRLLDAIERDMRGAA
jgi:hypothetical protein